MSISAYPSPWALPPYSFSLLVLCLRQYDGGALGLRGGEGVKAGKDRVQRDLAMNE